MMIPNDRIVPAGLHFDEKEMSPRWGLGFCAANDGYQIAAPLGLYSFCCIDISRTATGTNPGVIFINVLRPKLFLDMTVTFIARSLSRLINNLLTATS